MCTVSQSLYESILPLVKTQVESQIKVRDFSKASVTFAPAEYASWGDARSALWSSPRSACLSTNPLPAYHACVDTSAHTCNSCIRRPLKAQLQAELAAAPDDHSREEIQHAFASREKALEHDLDHKPMVRTAPHPLIPLSRVLFLG